MLSLALLGLYWYRGLNNVIHWDVLSELDEIPTVTNSFSDGELKYTINGNAYLVKERFLASLMQTNTVATYIFLAFFILGLNLLLAAFSALPRYWFLGGMVALAAVFVTFRIENVFNLTNQAGFLVAFAGFAGLAFYFNNYAVKASFTKRFTGFLIMTILAGGIIQYFSKISHPFLAVASYGLLSAVVFTVLFILLISHEIVASLVWIVSNSGIRGKSSLNQFIIVSSIYLLNILLIYLERHKYIDWNILAISPIVLFVISTVLGVWGFREATDESAHFNFRTIGAWLYFGLAIIASATISLAYATGNDPLIDAVESFIITAHLVVGIAFFMYVVLNFIQAMQKGLPIHRILYRPQFLELSLFRLGALVGIVALLSLKNFYAYYQATAGYYNTIADFYKASGDLAYAETFYKEATHNDIRNHKSNYALATLAMEANDKDNMGAFLKNALEKTPSPYAYAGLSKVLQEKDMFFDALFTMQEGVRKFPENQQLLTNLAWLYEKTKVTDSTFYYLNKAKENCIDCDLADANLLAFRLKYGKGDSLKNENTSLSLLANQSASAQEKKDISTSTLKLGNDSALNVSQFALIYNLTTVASAKAPFSGKDLQKIQQKEINQSFYEDLAFAIASQNYYRENTIEGIKQLTVLANDSTKKKQLYNQVVGMWYLQQGVFDKAIVHLTRAGDKASVDILQKQDYVVSIPEYQQAQAEELLKNAKTKADFDKALKNSPLNPIIISKTIEFYNTKLNKPNDAYKLVFNALEVNDNSAELWKLYVLQSLKIGVDNYAEDGLEKLRLLTSATDYQAFLSTYQAQKALMEKNKVGFE
ncbi:tetratricopeptide repeat protein [Emticicia fontis]